MKYIQNIRAQIADDQLDTALQHLRDLLDNSPQLDEVIQQSGRYADIRKQIRLGTVNHENATVTRNQIRMGLIELLTEIEKQGTQPNLQREMQAAISIINSKNINTGNITANTVEIGDKIYHIYGERKIPQALTYLPPRHEHFIGRQQELRDIYAGLRSDDRPLLLVNGQGGVGKTTLATYYFREYADEYAHIAWVTCEGNIAEDLISRLQDPLGIRDQLRNIIDRDHRTQILLRALVRLQKTCLLVLDNANDPADLHSHYQLLRSCPNFHILLTTRINEFRQANFYPIKGLPLDKAIELFEQYYRKLTDTETQTLGQIHQAVAANTLVVELLAKNLHQLNRLHTQYTLDHLLRDLREKGLLRLQSKTVHTDYGSLQHAKPEDIIAAMYDMNPLAQAERRLLSILSVLPPENLPFDTLQHLLPNFHKAGSKQKNIISKFLNFFRKGKQTNTTNLKLEDCLMSLYQKGWIDFNDKDKAFKISPVVQGIIRQKQQDQLYEDCETLIRNLIEKLDYEGGEGHLINATYEEAAIYARYGESIVEGFETPTYNLSWLCERIGNYYKAIGDLNRTILFFEKYSQLCRQLSKTNPNRSDYKSSVAISYERLGETHNSLGNLEKALQFFEQYNELGKQLYESYPQNASFKSNLAGSYEKLGSTYSFLGNLEKALQFFELNAELSKQLYESYPKNMSFKNSLAISYQRLGETYDSLGNLKKALESYERYNELEKQLYKSHPENVSVKNNLAISYQYLGNTHRLLGDSDKALKFFEQYNKLEKQLHEDYPQNVSFKNGLAISYQCLGVTHSSLGNLDKALELFEQYNELEKQLYESYPENVSFKDSLALSYEKLGSTHSLLGNLEKALGFIERYNELEKQLYESYPKNVSFKNGLCVSYSKLGEIHSKLGNIDKTLYCNEKDLELTEGLYESYPQNVQFKVNLGISYLNLGRFYLGKKGDKIKAKIYFIKSYDVYDELVRDFPAYVEFQANYDSIRMVLGFLQ